MSAVQFNLQLSLECVSANLPFFKKWFLKKRSREPKAIFFLSFFLLICVIFSKMLNSEDFKDATFLIR